MYKKKKRHYSVFILLLIMFMTGGIFGYHRYQVKLLTDESQEEEIVLKDNQKLQYFTLHSVLGNEITVSDTDAESEKLTTWTIPVGTEVVTKLGTITTFSRLASGDHIEVLTENTADGIQEIIKIWIVD